MVKVSAAALNRYTAVFALVLFAMCEPGSAQTAGNQVLGVTSQGSSGGLVVPSADVLPLGTMAVGYGNYQEPQLGATYDTHQNMVLGVGLLPNVELFGRLADYNNPIPGSIFFRGGIRDLSANLKVRLPLPWEKGPRIAIGANDVAGGAVNFKSTYVVATEQFGPLSASLGYAKPGTARPTFDGTFGALALRLGDSGFSALAEHDGLQRHIGLRWQSSPLEWLGRAQLVGSVQRSLGAKTPVGGDADESRFNVSLHIPLDHSAGKDFKPKSEHVLPDVDALADAEPTMQATAEDRLDSLRKALMDAGFENVRVGLRNGLAGMAVVIEYENHRYAHNEADALGLVLGLGAEIAPKDAQRIHAITLKQGHRLYETSVGVYEYRHFLRDGFLGQVRDSLVWEQAPRDRSGETRWIDVVPSGTSRVRVELKPDLNYTVGTEVGVFDYALAANLKLAMPLWSGAQVYTGVMVPVDHSSNMREGGVFAVSRQRSGLKSAAVQQTFWMGRQVLSQVAVGGFHYDVAGVQADTSVFVPGTDDVIRLRGAAYDKAPGGLAGQDVALSASFRHPVSPKMWIEVGGQRYSDGTSGPSVEWTNWFGDVSVQIYYRKGGSGQFAGLQFNFPLTPRKGMEPGSVFFTGAAQHAQGIRTRLTNADQPANLVLPSAVRDIQLDTSLDVAHLNAGRVGKNYFVSQLYRMREAYYTLNSRNSR